MTVEFSTTVIERDLRDLSEDDLLARAVPQVPRGTLMSLVARLGGLQGVYHASINNLCLTPGMTPDRARQLHAALELGLRLAHQRRDGHSMTCDAEIMRHIPASLGFALQEELWCMVLDTKNQCLATTMVYRGTTSSIAVKPVDIFRQVFRYLGTRVVVVHNHPSHDPTPSPEDRAITRELVHAGELIGIEVLDHLIVGGLAWVSLRRDSPHLWR